MSRPFKRKKGAVVAKLDGNERRVLLHLCDEIVELLSDDSTSEAPQWARDLGLAGVGEQRETPTDPVVARLLPDAYEDAEQAGEFRRLTEAGLRAKKLSHVEVVRRDLEQDPPVVITDGVQQWLSFLADCRLVLGTRLGVTEDDLMWPGLNPQKNLYLYLAFLQQSLVDVLIGE